MAMKLMKQITHNKKIGFCLIILLFAGLFGCSLNEKKIQPTTSSKKALKYFNKGLSLSDRLRNEEAAKYFEKAIEIDSVFALARLFLSNTYLSQKEQLEELNRASQMTSHISEGEKLLIESALAGIANDTEHQLEILNRALKLYPDDERLYFNLGVIHFNNQDYEKSIEFLEKATGIRHDCSPAYNLLGYSYRFLKDYEMAEKMFNIYIKLIPNDPNPYDSYAELLMEMGQFEESIEYFEKALSINPYFYFSRIGIASNLNFLEQHTEARNQIQLLYSTAQLEGQKQLALTSMAISYIDEENYNSAIKTINKRSEINIRNYDSLAIFNDYLQLAFLNSANGDYKTARELLDSVAQLLETADFPQVMLDNSRLNYLAVSMIIALIGKDVSKAREEVNKFNEAHIPDENSGFIKLRHQVNGMILQAEGKYEEALKQMRLTNLINSYNLFTIAKIYESVGNIDSALSYYDRSAYANLRDNIVHAYIRKKALRKLNELKQN